MSVKKIILVLGSLLLIAPLLILKLKENSTEHFTTFDHLSGPKNKTHILKESKTYISDFAAGANSRMAVLITDENSKWQDLINGLKSIGIPFMVTTNTNEALKHKVVFIYPLISGKVFTAEALIAISNHTKHGGVVIADNVLGGGLQDVFGYKKVSDGEHHSRINFSTEWKTLIKAKTDLTSKNEEFIALAKPDKKSSLIATAYEELKMPPLATYEDGKAAIIQNTFGSGSAYAFGIDLGQLFYLGHTYREEGIARTYVNNYEPTIDLFLRFIKNMYLTKNTSAVTLGTVPEGKELSIIITHDVDFAESVSNSLVFAKLEKEMSVKSTYFLQVKYLKDYNDKIFFDETNIKEMNTVHSYGMEIGSHSISHSRQFGQFPIGDGHESYPDYRPFVVDRELTNDGSVLGELRVSKFLIENKTEQKKVVSFRPGELANPYALPQSLQATEYLYSSSGTANNALTHMPYQLSYNREANQLLPLFEFPVTIEDEEFKDMVKQVPSALEVSELIANYGGLFVVLIHPNVLGHKLEFEKKIISHWKDRAWFGTISMFGDWWSKRNKVEIDQNDHVITINSPDEIMGLTIQLPSGIKIKSSKNVAKQIQDIVFLESFKGTIKIELEK